MEQLFLIFYYFIFTVCLLFIISGIDDLIYDIIYWTSFAYGKFTGMRNPTVENINQRKMLRMDEQPMAILIPCWHEDQVIDKMILNTMSALNYQNFDIFIGVYPNDLKTVEVVSQLAQSIPNVHMLINELQGPTTKGQNLNFIVKGVLDYSKKKKIEYAFFVMSDAEDVISPLELKLFNYLDSDYDMIQIPVFPLPNPWYNFTYWTYCDEFSELHTKDLVVRDLIHGLVASAGTGTAFSRDCMLKLLVKNNAVFDPKILTEDYDIALNLNIHGSHVAFVKEREVDPNKKPPWISIKEYFPDKYQQAVTQKARWIFGIVFQGWMKWHWQGNLLTKFCLFHDRKSIFSHFTALAGYLIIFIFLAVYFFSENAFSYLFTTDSVLTYMLYICFIMMLQRMLQRFIAVTTCYNAFQGLLSIPRIFYSNLINAHAFMRAFKHFLNFRKNRPVKWDKTEHKYPK